MSKRRRKPGAKGPRPLAWGGSARPGDRRIGRIAAVLVVLAAVAGGGYWWHAGADERAFRALAREGAPALAMVESEPDRGRAHLAPGTPYDYRTPFPTSGPHDPGWTATGFHTARQMPTRLVHALEHGNVVVYYDRPGEEALDTLRRWAALYPGMWDGLVVTPGAGLGEAVVLTAWTRRLRLEPFEAAAAAAFIDAHRGRGPENPVR
jgi:hypothetical protein